MRFLRHRVPEAARPGAPLRQKSGHREPTPCPLRPNWIWRFFIRSPHTEPKATATRRRGAVKSCATPTRQGLDKDQQLQQAAGSSEVSAIGSTVIGFVVGLCMTVRRAWLFHIGGRGLTFALRTSIYNDNLGPELDSLRRA